MKRIEGSRNFIANTAAIFAQSFSNPRDLTVITLPDEPPVKNLSGMAFDQALKRRPPISLSPKYKFILILVTSLTVGAAIAAAVMAQFWGDHPDAMQQQVFDAMGTAWKMGFGALVGLLGGKQINGDSN